MTTCVEPVEVKRMIRVKRGLDFENKWSPVAEVEAEVRPGESSSLFLFPHDFDVRPEDHIFTSEGVYSVKEVDHHALKRGAVAEFLPQETEIRVLEAAGYVEDGVEVMEGRDDPADRFMDSWVGTYAIHIVGQYQRVRQGKSLQALYGVAEGTPIAVVGAGPSLDSNFRNLKDFPGIIMCVDKSYKMLLGRGIEPDLVVSVDCHPDLIAEMMTFAWNGRHTAILNSCSDPQIADRWGGKIFWYNMKHPGVQWCDRVLPAIFPHLTGIPNVGCVGNTCLMVGAHMNAGQIVLVGMDYGYTGGRMHAQRFEPGPDGNLIPFEVDHAKMMEARSGKMEVDGIVTYVAHRGYALTAKDIADKLALNVVNCTEGGILRGLPQRTLEEEVADLREKGFSGRATRERIANA